MPFLRIQTNAAPAADRADALLAAATKAVASGLGKPERYVMVVLEPGSLLMFAGSKEPAALLELSGIDLSEDQAGRLAGSLCSLLQEQAEVAKERVFIIFTSVGHRMWGWNGTTF